MAAYENLIRFLESKQLQDLSGVKLSDAITALEALVETYFKKDATGTLLSKTTDEKYSDFKELSGTKNKYFWERSFWEDHPTIVFDLITGDGKGTRIELPEEQEAALSIINKKAQVLLNSLLARNTQLEAIKKELADFKIKVEHFLKNHEKKITDTLELNRIDLYHSIHNNTEKVRTVKDEYEALAIDLGKQKDRLEQYQEARSQDHTFLLNGTDTVEIVEWRAKLQENKKIIKHHIDQCQNAIARIKNDENGLLKTIDDAQNLDYIFLGNGVTYTLRTADKNIKYKPATVDNRNSRAGHQANPEADQLKYMSIRKRDASEVGVFKKTYLQADKTEDKSVFLLRGNSNKDETNPLEWESEKFPETDADRQDHAFRWAIEIVRKRPKSPYTPIYLTQGTKNPEEIEYLSKALQIVLKWEEEKILTHNPDAKIDPNQHKIVSNSKGWKPSGWLGRGLSSLYNSMVNGEITEQYKKEFQAAKEDVVRVEVGFSEGATREQKAAKQKAAANKQEVFVEPKVVAVEEANGKQEVFVEPKIVAVEEANGKQEVFVEPKVVAVEEANGKQEVSVEPKVVAVEEANGKQEVFVEPKVVAGKQDVFVEQQAIDFEESNDKQDVFVESKVVELGRVQQNIKEELIAGREKNTDQFAQNSSEKKSSTTDTTTTQQIDETGNTPKI